MNVAVFVMDRKAGPRRKNPSMAVHGGIEIVPIEGYKQLPVVVT